MRDALFQSAVLSRRVRRRKFRHSFSESSSIPGYMASVHKSILGWEGYYDDTRLNTVPLYVLNTSKTALVKIWIGLIINNIITSTMIWRGSSASPSSDQFHPCRGIILEASLD